MIPRKYFCHDPRRLPLWYAITELEHRKEMAIRLGCKPETVKLYDDALAGLDAIQDAIRLKRYARKCETEETP